MRLFFPLMAMKHKLHFETMQVDRIGTGKWDKIKVHNLALKDYETIMKKYYWSSMLAKMPYHILQRCLIILPTIFTPVSPL